MEEYRTEEEQVEALSRWWKENGRSLLVAVVIAVAASFGWQSWQSHQAQQQGAASDHYQSLLRALGGQDKTLDGQVVALAQTLKSQYGNTTYAQFAALHLATLAVQDNNMAAAQEELRWTLAKAPKGSDIAQVAQLRLARVLAASGDIEQALTVLEGSAASSYAASYAVAEGDILLAAGRDGEAREAYASALAAAEAGRVNLPALQQKLQSLAPTIAKAIDVDPLVEVAEPVIQTQDGVDVAGE